MTNKITIKQNDELARHNRAQFRAYDNDDNHVATDAKVMKIGNAA